MRFSVIQISCDWRGRPEVTQRLQNGAGVAWGDREASAPKHRSLSLAEWPSDGPLIGLCVSVSLSLQI